MWALFDFVTEGQLLGDRRTFQREFASNIIAVRRCFCCSVLSSRLPLADLMCCEHVAAGLTVDDGSNYGAQGTNKDASQRQKQLVSFLAVFSDLASDVV